MLTFYQTLCDRYQAGELPELIAQQVYNPSVLRDMAVYRTYLRLKDEYESRYGLSSCSPRKKGRLMQQLKVAVCELYPSTKRCAPHIEVSTLERIIFRMEILD